jgi:glycerophosphoryl diester phosphodiesterase
MLGSLSERRARSGRRRLRILPGWWTDVRVRGRGIRVPRLEGILARWPDARVNIDPKSDPCVAPLAGLLDRLGAWDRVCVGSFSDRRLRRIRALGRGRACTSMGPQAVALARLTTASADCVQVPIREGPIRIVTQRFIAAAHGTVLTVHVSTSTTRQTISELLDLGVDGIMSDRLRLLKGAVTRHRALAADDR